MYVYSSLGNYGLIGTFEEMSREMEGVANWVMSAGTHKVRKPASFCLSEADIGRLIGAVELRASAMGWSIDSIEIVDCTHGSPPGQQAIFTITVPEVEFRLDQTIRGAALPRTPARQGFTPAASGESTLTEDESGALVEVDEEAKKTPTWIYVVGGLAAVTVVGGVAYYIWKG